MLKQNKIIFILILIMFSILTITIVSAQLCEVENVKDNLAKALFDYFNSPNSGRYNKTELKDLLNFYLKNSNFTTVNCDIKAPVSSTNYNTIVSNFSNVTKNINFPTCSDGTRYGKCSTTKPLYCFAGRLVNRCRLCGCASNDFLCQTNLTSTTIINEGKWGKCVLKNVTAPQNVSCIDSDEGLNYSVKGTITFTNGTNLTLTDWCTFRNGGAWLVEYQCINNPPYSISNGTSCPNGCDNGACLNVTTNVTCTDTDGTNYYNKGAVTFSNGTNYSDYCSGTSYLTEFQCINNSLTSSYANCFNGCSNGACLNVTVPLNLTCSDGTVYGNCSVAKPKYCLNKTLINKCTSCGCLSGQICLSNGDCNLNNSESDFVGEYYNNENLQGEPVLIRNDPEINFNWIPNGSPDPKVNEDHFSARWTKMKEFISGRYRFTVQVAVEDNVRLWIDNNLIIDRWGREWGDEITTYTAEINLQQGLHIIRMEYSDLMSWAFAKLSWEVIEVHNAYCKDGTLYNKCSITKPKYCLNGTLIDKCTSCGCSLGQVCREDGICVSIGRGWVYQEFANEVAKSNALYINYTKPPNASQTLSRWQVKHGGLNIYNITIPNDCWKAYPDKLVLKIDSYLGGNIYDPSPSRPSCYDGFTWNKIGVEATGAGGFDGSRGFCGDELYDGNWSTWCVNIPWANLDIYPSTWSLEYEADRVGPRIYEEAMWWYIENVTAPVNQTCTDTDGGINYFTKGTVSYLGFNGTNWYTRYNGTDWCNTMFNGSAYVNNGNLTELYCLPTADSLGNMHNSSVYRCPNGCSSGACVNISANVTCTDTDGGLNYYNKGTITFSNGTNTSDRCLSPTQITEYQCLNNSLFSTMYYCPCVDGVCINNSCTDSDGGLNYYTKGTLTFANGTIYTDFCSSQVGTLIEHQCTNNPDLGSVGYICPNGCLNGACISSVNYTCSDGTSNLACSITKPKYCLNGTLINNCNSCGCPTNQSCQADGSCMTIVIISNFSDGSSEKNITINETTQNQTVYVEVPSGTNITNATIGVTTDIPNASLSVGSEPSIPITPNETVLDISPEINGYIANNSSPEIPSAESPTNLTGGIIFTNSKMILVPLIFHSEYPGTIRISSIKITYLIEPSLVEEISFSEKIKSSINQIFTGVVIIVIILIILWIIKKKRIRKIKR